MQIRNGLRLASIAPAPYVAAVSGDLSLARLYAGRRVLVVGATGFLGANCAYALQTLGAEATVVARKPASALPGFTGAIMPGDLIDRAVAEKVVKDHDIVFDFLGYPKLTPSACEPVGDLEEEMRPHINLFTACAASSRNPVLVHCSSRLVYGAPQYLPIDEKHPTIPRSIYAVHKLTMEHYLHTLAQTAGLRQIIVRLSSPFGPNGGCEPGRLGVLNQFMVQAAKGEPITIFGTGEQMRDYIFIDDAVRAFLLLGGSKQCVGQTFNVGGERGVRLRDAVYSIARIAGDAPVRHEPWPDEARAVETGSFCSSLEKLRRFVPYNAAFSFDRGVETTIKWIRSILAERSTPAATTGGHALTVRPSQPAFARIAT